MCDCFWYGGSIKRDFSLRPSSAMLAWRRDEVLIKKKFLVGDLENFWQNFNFLSLSISLHVMYRYNATTSIQNPPLKTGVTSFLFVKNVKGGFFRSCFTGILLRMWIISVYRHFVGRVNHFRWCAMMNLKSSNTMSFTRWYVKNRWLQNIFEKLDNLSLN